mgnify:CR=1 FL=1
MKNTVQIYCFCMFYNMFLVKKFLFLALFKKLNRYFKKMKGKGYRLIPAETSPFVLL